MRLRTCDPSNLSQYWEFSNAGQEGQIKLAGTALCLTFPGNPKKKGTRATVGGCGTRTRTAQDRLKLARQKWTMVKIANVYNLHGLGGILQAAGSWLVKGSAAGSPAARFKIRRVHKR